MPNDPGRVTPRTFFLNEQHELARGEKEGGGSLPKLAPIDWAAKGRQIQESLDSARQVVRRSRDPLRESRYFLATTPSATIKKLSKDRRRTKSGPVEVDEV